MIQNLKELAAEVGAEEDAKSIARRLYKDTRCGISFWTDGKVVVLSGYCEGTDAECPPREYTFPFEEKVFWEGVEAADQDGCDLWDQTHGCPECGDEIDGYIPVNPDCESCGGDGIVI